MTAIRVFVHRPPIADTIITVQVQLLVHHACFSHIMINSLAAHETYSYVKQA